MYTDQIIVPWDPGTGIPSQYRFDSIGAAKVEAPPWQQPIGMQPTHATWVRDLEMSSGLLSRSSSTSSTGSCGGKTPSVGTSLQGGSVSS